VCASGFTKIYCLYKGPRKVWQEGMHATRKEADGYAGCSAGSGCTGLHKTCSTTKGGDEAFYAWATPIT